MPCVRQSVHTRSKLKPASCSWGGQGAGPGRLTTQGWVRLVTAGRQATLLPWRSLPFVPFPGR